MSDEKICFIVPVFNEEDTISTVINEIKSLGNIKIIVIDDCSTDRTSEIISNLDVICIRHENNMGYDFSLNTGFKKAYELDMNFAITIDADGQHHLEDAKKIIDLLLKGNSIVKGNRKLLPRLSEKIYSIYTKTFYDISDPLCGLKGYSLKDCKNFEILNPNNMIGTRVLLNCKRNKLQIADFEIKEVNRFGLSRYGGSFKANLKIFIILASLIFTDILRLLRIK